MHLSPKQSLQNSLISLSFIDFGKKNSLQLLDALQEAFFSAAMPSLRDLTVVCGSGGALRDQDVASLAHNFTGLQRLQVSSAAHLTAADLVQLRNSNGCPAELRCDAP